MSRVKMQDKNLRKHMIGIVMAVAVGVLLANITVGYFLKQIERQNNEALAVLLGNVKLQYPDIAEEEWIAMLNNAEGYAEGRALLERYGIFAGDFTFAADRAVRGKLLLCLDGILCVTCIGAAVIFLRYLLVRRGRIEQLKEYVCEVEQGKYVLDITENEEDELSVLKNELYKITVMLKESAELQKRQKNALANSLADISHQLKTPLTSVMVLLDNLSESSHMEEQTRQRFLAEITRQLENINWLVAALLKLSRLDAGVVEFERKQVNVDALLTTVTENIKPAAERKQVRIKREGEKGAVLSGDYRWLTEAVTNIVKNAIEHSFTDSEIEIWVKDNAVYTAIGIRDFGEGVEEADQKRIFERFYRSRYAKEDSVGIGLSLAKEIIERQQGYLTVETREQGTLFQIKFLKS
ncbi:MAG: HAMP domain-containing histidine kinase [Lachnospiraceae bacterium]|nr:HAMP domain-containing histidine kinase [Lachnospiraceae bacterium]